MDGRMEEVIALDGGRGFGLLTRASGTPRGTTVVLLNAGLIHRVGPFRLYVRLARELAADGFDVLRFDLPGIGDGYPGSHATDQSFIGETFDAVQAMTGSRDFVIGGICSAADQGWRCAVSDRRVTGLLLLDGMAHRNLWFRIAQFTRLTRKPLSAWLESFRKLLRPKSAAISDIDDFRDWPTPTEFRSQLADMLARGVRIFAFYTGGIPYYLLHRKQFDTTFGPFRDHALLHVEYWPDLDHTLFSPVDRGQVMGRIKEWCGNL